jgi:hypothetical protein
MAPREPASDALQKSIDQLTDMMARQGDQLDQMLAMLRRREAELKKVRAENRRLRELLGLPPEPDPDGSMLPDPDTVPDIDDPDFDDGLCVSLGPKACIAIEDDDSEVCPDVDILLVVEPKKPRPRSKGGRRPPPDHLPAEVEHHAVCACAACGGRVFKRDVLETSVYTVVPAHVRRRLIRRERVICADPTCNLPTTAPMPPMPCRRALYDCSFLAWLVASKFEMLVPLDRTRLQLRSRGVDLAMGSLVGQIERAADLLAPIDGYHMKLLRQGDYFCFNGTGLKTLIPGQEQAWDGYLEVFTRDVITVLQYDVTKHADRLQRRIGAYDGLIVSDAESRNAAGAPDATLVYCNAHPLRKFEAAARSQPVLAYEAVFRIREMYRIEAEATELGLFGSDRTAYRQQHTRPIADAFRAWLTELTTSGLPPSDPVLKVARYYLKYFASLTRFIDDGCLPIDNNEAEREFQRHAKLRHASLFAGSVEGARRWAILLGVVRTAQKCGVDVEAYLKWVFERRGSHRKAFGMSAAELTPMAYRDLVQAQRATA